MVLVTSAFVFGGIEPHMDALGTKQTLLTAREL